MIHNTAIIDPAAELASNVEVGPYVIIGRGVKIGNGTVIGPHVLVEADTVIGENNKIFHGASIGGAPQDVSFKNEKTFVSIGDGNIIREYVTIHKATKEGKSTVVGNNNYFMAYSHVGHDCIVGNGIVVTNGTGLSGHVIVEDFAVISAYVGIHQFSRIGSMAMVGALSRVNQDILPYTMVEGNPARTFGLNIVGLRRNGLDSKTRGELKKAYKLLCKKKLTIDNAISRIGDEVELLPEVKHLIAFVKETKRGIIR